MRTISYSEALAEGLREEMDRDERVFLIGEDIGPVREPGDDLFAEMKQRRVWQTPISEAGFTGLAVGAAAAGLRPVVEIMYCDFVTVCMDQICNQAAKLNLMSGGQFKAPLVFKTPAGAGTREGGHHSQSLEAWFMHTAGLKVVMPATVYDAKGLLKASIRDEGPVVFIQHRLLHPVRAEVPRGEWVVELGQASVKRPGSDITVIGLGYALTRALAAAEALAGEISVEVIDPRTLVPLDVPTLAESAGRTGRLLVVHEAPERGGAGAEIIRQLLPEVWGQLRAAPQVSGSRMIPMPYSPVLEDYCLPAVADIVTAIREVCA